MFFDPFEPLINVLILPANSLALFLVQKLRERLRRLGMDEIALRKGQGQYVVVLVDLDQRSLIGLAASRKHEDIQTVLDGWGRAVLNQITEVSIDLSGNYRGLVRKQMPNAQVVADRFHVAQLVSRELNAVRNQEIRLNRSLLDEAEQTRIQKVLKSSKYALLKPEENRGLSSNGTETYAKAETLSISSFQPSKMAPLDH